MTHKQFTLTVVINVCDGMQSKFLEEVRQWRLFSENNFDHAINTKVYVTHKEISE